MPDSCAGQRVRCAVCDELVYVPGGHQGQASVNAGRARVANGPPKFPDAKPSGSGTVDDSKKRSVPPPLPSPTAPTERTPAEPTPATSKHKPAPRDALAGRPSLMRVHVDQPDQGNRATVKWLALVLVLVVAFSLAPVFHRGYLNVATAPGWARVALLLAAVQAGYVAWMLIAPDWASVWVVMLVFAAASVIYAAATAMALATPPDQPMLLGMGEVRTSAGRWCASVLLAMSLATYLCGRTATRWHRALELETANKGRPRR